MEVLADVDLTVGARDETGQTLSNIDSRLVDMNKTLERQVGIFEKAEKEYARFADRIEMSAPTIKGVFDNMHTELTNINKALRDNQKAQKDFNNETAKAGKSGGQGHSLNTQLLKKTSDVEVAVRNEKRKDANRAAIAEEDSYNQRLLQKQKEGSQERNSELNASNEKKASLAKSIIDRKLKAEQIGLDREFASLKESNAERLSEVMEFTDSKDAAQKISQRKELKAYDKTTKQSVASTKDKHDRIMTEHREFVSSRDNIRKLALANEIADSERQLESAKASASAQTQSVVNERTNQYERERLLNQEFRGKAIAELETEQKREINKIDGTRKFKLELTKRSHINQMAEMTDYLNKKDSVAQSAFNRDIQQEKHKSERISETQDNAFDEQVSNIKSKHDTIETEAKRHESQMLQIKKHARRMDLEKVSHEREFGREGLVGDQRSTVEARKKADEEQIRDAKRRAKTLKEISAIELEETLANQQNAHKRQLADDNKFADEKIDYIKRSSKEAIAIMESEVREIDLLRKQSAKENLDTLKKQNDRRFAEQKESQDKELELLKRVGVKAPTRRERRNEKKMDALLDERQKVKNILEDSYDKEISQHQQAAAKQDAILRRAATNAIAERQKQYRTEVRALSNKIEKELALVQESSSQFEIQHKKERRLAIHNLNVKHEREIGEINAHDNVKIALKQESQEKEKQDTIRYYDELYAIERGALEKSESQLKISLRTKIARKESERDKDLVSTKSHHERIGDVEKESQTESLARLESYKRKRLAEIEHMTEMEAEKLRQVQRKLSKRIGDTLKQTGIGKFISKADRGITGFLAADFAMIGVREVADFVRGLGRAVIKMEAMKLSLTAVEGSAERAYDQLKKIAEIAKLPGVHLESAIKTTVTLRALKLEAGLVEKTIINIGNALATLGRESELGGVTLALSQIIGKGKVHAEEINQIAERLPLIRGILVEQFGTANTEILQRMNLNINEFIAKITEGLGNLPKVATTIGTEFKNMQNQWFLFKASLGTLVKPALMGAMRGATALLEAANKSLDRANEKQKQEAITKDQLVKSRKYTDQYLIGYGIDKTSTDLTKEHGKKTEKFAESYRKVSAGERVAKSTGGGFYNLKTLTADINKHTAEALQHHKRVVNYRKNIEKASLDELDLWISILAKRQKQLRHYSSLEVLREQGSVGRGDIDKHYEYKRTTKALEGYKEVEERKLIEALDKATGKTDRDKAKKLADATKVFQESVLKEILGVGFKTELTEQDTLQLKESAKRGGALNAIDFSIFTNDLEAFQIEKERVIGERIAALNTQQQKHEKKSDLNKFGAARDLFPDKTKGLKETDPKMIEFARQSQKMQLEIIRSAYDVLRAETRTQIEQAFQFELDYQKWRTDQEVQLADRLLKLWKDIDLVPKTQEGVMAQIISEVMDLKSIVPEQFRERFSGFSSAQSMAGNVESRLRESSAVTTAAETDRPSTFIHKARYAEMNALAQQYIDVTDKEIDGRQRSLEETVSHISFLKSKLPEFEKYVKERQRVENRITSLQKDRVKAEVKISQLAADKLGKAPDILYRSVVDIAVALKEAKMRIKEYETAGRDDRAKPFISAIVKLEKELTSAEKRELQQDRGTIKSQMSREMAEGITVDRIQSFYQQFEDLQTEAESLGFTDIAKSLQSDLDSTYRAEINLRQRNIRELETTLDKIGKYSMLRPDEISDIAGRTTVGNAELTGTQALSDMVIQNIRDKEVERYRGQDELEQQSWYSPPKAAYDIRREGPTGTEGQFSPVRRGELAPQGRQMLKDYAEYQSDRSTPEPLPFDTKGFTEEEIDNMEAYRDIMMSTDRQIQDHALSAAGNIISAWQGVSSQTDTMLDDVVGAVGQIAVNLTQTILNIQRSSALASSSTGLTSTLGSFAKYAGIAGIGLTAAATIWSFVDQKNEGKTQRNRVSRSRPNSISRR